MPRSENKQIAINMISQIAAFVIQFGISFFLAPFIVRSLGVEAYGFVGLATAIIGYLQIISIALNSMAGRFISIEYHKGNIEKANIYFTSVFYSNCILSALISLICLILGYNLEYIINIPEPLIADVKMLFILMTVNTAILMVFNVFTVVPFVKNRLEITALRDLLSKVIYAIIMVVLFMVFSPYLCYLGIAAVISSVYLIFANIIVKRKLAPEFSLSYKTFDTKSVKELLSSGVWNLFISVGRILERGFDILFANWFINATYMGLLSVVTSITIMIPKVIKTASFSFAPTITELGAKGDINGMKRNITKSIKIMSLLMLMPLVVLYVVGDNFFAIWLPGQDSSLLYIITILSTAELVFGLPLEVCWTIFSAMNKVKLPAISMFISSALTFVTVLLLLLLIKNPYAQIICLASTRSFWNIIRNITFLPYYGSKCLYLNWRYIYQVSKRPFIGIAITLLTCISLKPIFNPTDWTSFIIDSAALCVIALIVGGTIILDKDDRIFIISKIKLSFAREKSVS